MGKGHYNKEYFTPTTQDHFLYIISYTLIPNMHAGEASSTCRFCKCILGKVGVSHTSVFISPVQKLVWKITAQHWVGKKVDFHVE